MRPVQICSHFLHIKCRQNEVGNVLCSEFATKWQGTDFKSTEKSPQMLIIFWLCATLQHSLCLCRVPAKLWSKIIQRFAPLFIEEINVTNIVQSNLHNKDFQIAFCPLVLLFINIVIMILLLLTKEDQDKSPPLKNPWAVLLKWVFLPLWKIEGDLLAERHN